MSVAKPTSHGGPSMIDGRYSLTSDPTRHGGMSIVNKAWDIQKSRFVAIKRMKLNAADEVRWQESFNREYSALDDLTSHRNIVDLYDAGRDEDGSYIVLEWVDQSLSDYVTQHGPMSWADFYNHVGRPVLEALAFAQSRNWTHRDIKPQNILIASDGSPRISDYGIAKKFDRPSLGVTFSAFRSAPFTPPEDDLPQFICSRDCFSWAAVAIFCLTGKVAGDYGTQETTLLALSAEQVPVDILQAAISNNPEERPVLASGLLADLDTWMATNAKGLVRRRTCHLKLNDDAARKLQAMVNIDDRSEFRRKLLDELNEIDVGVKRIEDAVGDKVGLRIFAVTWVFEVLVNSEQGVLVVTKGWLSRPADLERRREGSFRPTVTFSLDAPADRTAAATVADEMLLELESYEVESKLRALEAVRERVFKIWYAFLRAKADLESRRENAIRFINRRVENAFVVFVTELPASLDLIGQSRMVRIAAGQHVFGDVVDVNLEEVVVSVTAGDASKLPKEGSLELNTIAAEKAIDRQRSALDAVNYNRTPNPRLKAIISEPAINREPAVISPLKPIEGGAFDAEKLEILKRALGVADVLAIQGPPGTGKTRLIEEILIQYLALNPGHRVLLSAQTHVALDNVLDRLHIRQPSIDIVRIGRVDDQKISVGSRAFILDRKAEKWAEGVRAQAAKFLSKWAEDHGIDKTNTEIGMLANRLRLRLQQEGVLSKGLKEAGDRLRSVDEDTRAKLEKTGSAASAELEETSIEAQQQEAELKAVRALVRSDIEEIKARLKALGEFGQELAENDSDEDLRVWASMLLDDGDDQAHFLRLLELHEEWALRVGKSSDFHAAMLASAQVVAGTCIGMARVKGMGDVVYDLCIVDEASKATATEILVPMSRSRRWILVGDPEQLPPFFEEDSVTRLDDFEEAEVRQTLLDRFLAGLPDHSRRQLLNQYRMAKPIGDLISEAFYDGKLSSPKEKPDVVLTGLFPKAVTWISTSELSDRYETIVSKSVRNDAECRIIRKTLENIDFIARKRRATYTVALIAGYGAQVKALQDQIRDRLHEWKNVSIVCSTVDAFQGSEADFCIYSVTRSNEKERLGFLAEKPRLNVALSRGKSGLIIIGDDVFCREVAGKNPFRPVLDFIERHPEICERRKAS